MLQRFKLTIAYRGTAYHGWQYQIANERYRGPAPRPGQGIPTVQEILARALVHVVKHPVTLVGSSRTDSGVHAKGQLAHFDTDKSMIDPESLRRATNHQLPDDILVRKVEPVDQSFSAILSTVRKRYQYFIWNEYDRTPFMSDLYWHRWQELSIPAMQEAATYLAGEHDFKTFARAKQKRGSTIRTIYDLSVVKRGPRLVIGVEGNGFLWNMIRIIAGTLVEVGLGRFQPRDMIAMLDAKDRRAGGSTAPPQGLYLQWIKTTDEKEGVRGEEKGRGVRGKG